MICHHIFEHRVSGGEFNDFRHLKMRKSVGKPKLVLPYISLCLSSTLLHASNDQDYLL